MDAEALGIINDEGMTPQELDEDENFQSAYKRVSTNDNDEDEYQSDPDHQDEEMIETGA